MNRERDTWVTAQLLRGLYGFTEAMVAKVQREARKGKVATRPSNYCRTDKTYSLQDCYAVFTGGRETSRKVEGGEA